LTPSELNDKEKQFLVKLAMAILGERHRPGQALCSPGDTSTFLRLRLAERKNEVFGCLFLDNHHRIIEVSELFQGTIDGASVHPRVVVQQALRLNAAALVFYHNHTRRGWPNPAVRTRLLQASEKGPRPDRCAGDRPLRGYRR
jgi:DNA repair protein RadC